MNKEWKRRFRAKLKKRLGRMYDDCMRHSMAGNDEGFFRSVDDTADWVLDKVEETNLQ